jgi:hypothetical protein
VTPFDLSSAFDRRPCAETGFLRHFTGLLPTRLDLDGSNAAGVPT